MGFGAPGKATAPDLLIYFVLILFFKTIQSLFYQAVSSDQYFFCKSALEQETLIEHIKQTESTKWTKVLWRDYKNFLKKPSDMLTFFKFPRAVSTGSFL